MKKILKSTKKSKRLYQMINPSTVNLPKQNNNLQNRLL